MTRSAKPRPAETVPPAGSGGWSRLATNARSRRTCAAMLSSARDLLEADGSDAVTMGAVADRAGVTRRAVYLHFASRTELLVALFGYVSEAEGLDESLQPVWDAPDSVAALDEWARHLARFHPRVLPVARAIEQVRRSDPDAEAHWSLVTRDRYACCRRLARWLADEDRLAAEWTTATAADMLLALMSFDVLESLTVDRRWSNRRYATHLATVLRSTFVRD